MNLTNLFKEYPFVKVRISLAWDDKREESYFEIKAWKRECVVYHSYFPVDAPDTPEFDPLLDAVEIAVQKVIMYSKEEECLLTRD